MSIAKEVAALERMGVKELQARYAQVFGEETHAHHRAWLAKRIAWRMQALAEGDLSERARQRAAELANDADLRLNPPQPKTRPTNAVAAVDANIASAPPGVSDRAALTPDQRLPRPGAVL